MVSASQPASHIVIFPYMAQGHTLPLLDLSKALSHRGLKITIITTPLNAQYIHSKVSKHPQISLSIIPFPRVEGLPEGCENTSNLPSPDLFLPFMVATEKLKEPFERLLKDMFEAESLPICVISDFFLPWTLDSCSLFGIPRLVSHGMGVLPMAVAKASALNRPCINVALDSDSTLPFLQLIKVPFILTRTDLPDSIRHANADDDPWSRFMAKVGEADKNSWGFVVNSFEELEGDYIYALESFSRKNVKAWCVGPLLLLNHEIEHEGGDSNVEDDQSCPYIEWLNKQDGPNIVIYVSFGTQSQVSNKQMDEIALGLEMAGHPFLWVTRSKTWDPPNGWEEKVKERGFVVRDWVEQRSILAHPSTGGFLSHCGWNSVLESLSMGVPLLAWPMGAEQPLNAKYVAEGLGAGVVVPRGEESVAVQCDVICDGVKELMSGERGRKARERAKAFGQMAKQAVEKGGSSDTKLDELIEHLTLERKNYVKSTNFYSPSTLSVYVM